MVERDADVIVIGAGAAGLMAAQQLQASGHDVVVLEARARIGGRIQTLRQAGQLVPVELGAEFIHGHPAAIFEMVRGGYVHTDPVPDDRFILRDGRLQPAERFEDNVGRVLERTRGLEADESFESFLQRRCMDLSDEARRMATAYVEGFNAADKRDVSTQWLRESEDAEDGSEIHFVRNGYASVVEHLARGLDIRLNSPVIHVEWSPGWVVAYTQAVDGSLTRHTARRLVFTVPIGVLKGAPLAFDPPLPEFEEALRFMRSGQVIKVLCRLDREILPREHHVPPGFLHALDATFPTWWSHGPVLTAWAAGPDALRLIDEDPGRIADRAVDQLALMVSLPRKRLRAAIGELHVTDWHNDPFARGAYSYVAVGGTHAPDVLARPVADTIFYAGEAAHRGLTGTVAAALESGRHAAAMILRSSEALRPPARPR